MKKVISLVLVAAMLLTMSLTGFATMLEDNDMLEALKGDHQRNQYGAENSGMIDAYKNVSPAQMDAMVKLDQDKVLTDYNDVNNAIWTGILTETGDDKTREMQFILGVAELMFYAQDELPAIPRSTYFKDDLNGILNTNLERVSDLDAADDGYELWKAGYGALDYYAGGTLTKDAFGALIIDLKSNFVNAVKADKDNVLTVWNATTAEAYLDGMEGYVVKALSMVLDDPKYPEFKVNAKPAMVTNGFVKAIDNSVAPESTFVKWVKETFDFLKAVDKNAASMVANNIISGILDIDLVTDSQRIAPNGTVSVGYGFSVDFDIKTAEKVFAGKGDGVEINLDETLTSWFDAKLIDYDGNAFPYATVTYSNNKFKLTNINSTGAARYGVLQLYRNGTANVLDEAPEQLVAEFRVYAANESTGSSGGGGRTQFQVTFMSDGKVHKNVNVVNGKLALIPSNPQKDGYNFKGWSLDGETVVDPNTIELTNKTVFYAVFSAIPALDKENHFAYVIGYPDGEFKPEQNITRAEAATIFCRLLVEKIDVAQQYYTDFTDVPEEEWYHDYVAYAEELGIVTGYPDGTYRPDEPITRAEFATIASRFDNLEITETEPTFNDIDDSHWAFKYVESAAAKGWVMGYEDGSFRPENYITREETVTIVNRMLERAADKEYVEVNQDAIIDYTDIDNTRWSYYEIIEASNSHLYDKLDEETWTSVDNSNNYH